MTVAADLLKPQGCLRRYFLRIGGLPYVLCQRVAGPDGDDTPLNAVNATMHPLDADVICAYRFDEAAGTDDAVDASGNGYTMTESGDPPLGDHALFTSSRNVRATVSTGHHFAVADAAPLRRDVFTAAAWIYLTQVATYINYPARIMQKCRILNDSIARTWGLDQYDYLGGDSRSYRFYASVRVDTAPDATEIKAQNPAATVAGWNHVGMTYDGAWLRLYVNGTLVASTENTTGTATLVQGDGALEIPGHYNGGYFDIDDAAYYEEVKDAAWFAARYSIGGINCLHVPGEESSTALDLGTMKTEASSMVFVLDDIEDPDDE